MKRLNKVALGGCCLLLPAIAFAQQARMPQSFVPAGYRLLTEAKGDLNKDGIEDRALVVENTNPKNITVKEKGTLGPDTLNLNNRKLLVLFGNGKGLFRKVSENATLLPSENDADNACLSDPLMQDGGIDIQKGVLKIDLQYWYSCGSWYVTHNTYTLRWQENRMVLIGLDGSDFHRASGERNTVSINLSTRRRAETKGENEFEDTSNPKTVWTSFKSPKTFYLEDLTAESFSEISEW